MDAGYKLKERNPKENAYFISKLFFTWVLRLFHKATHEGLQIIDLYIAVDGDKSGKLARNLEKHWENELNKAKVQKYKPSLMKALCKTFLFNYMLWGLLFFVHMAGIRTLQPMVLSYLIKLFVSTSNENKSMEMYISSALLIGLSTTGVFIMHHCNFGMLATGMRIRIAVSSLVYRKITKLNQKSLGETAAGQIVNLLSNDVNRFDLVVAFLHSLWIMPFLVALVTYLLWQEVGISSLAGVVSMAILSLPFQGYLGKLTGTLRLKVARKTDRRVRLMSEIITGIQVIKMYAWEKPFEKMIQLARATEIADLTSTSYIRGILASCSVFVERVALCLTVVCYVLLGNVITADKAFSMAQFFNLLQFSMAILYPLAISHGAETWVSVKRLEDFLILEEIQESKIESHHGHGIQFTNVSASWTTTSPTLKDVTLQIPPGTLCAVIGPVGAGKSSLLQILLGELPVSSGKVYLGGEISYSSQVPWLFASTVRNNILFGQPYNKFWYEKVVKVCALERDFEQFPLGDKTTVGERGVSLSGGQRARINLARAIYRQADIYLLDDPLSAVDTHVGRHLFDECIHKHLRGKTRILVTHQLQYLKKANLIIVINEGKIEAQGSFADLADSKLDFTKMLAAADESTDKPEEIEKELVLTVNRKMSVLSLTGSIISESYDSMEENIDNGEEQEVTRSKSPLKEYFKSARNICLVIIVMFLLVAAQGLSAGSDFWISFWTQQEEIRHLNDSHIIESRAQKALTETIEVYNVNAKNLPYYTYTRDINATYTPRAFSFSDLSDTVEVGNNIYSLLKTEIAMYLYGGIVISGMVLTIFRSLLFIKVCMMCSKNLHSKMFHCLLKAPMRFFDINPSGRVLNRFSKDMGAIDEILPRVLLEAIQIILVMVGVLVNIGVTNPYIIIVMVVLGAVFSKIRGWYIKIAKDIKHMEGTTKSPVFSHVNSTLNGITTIRASKAQDVLITEFDNHQDVHTSAWYLTIICMVSFGLWLDIVCLVFITTVTFSFVVLNDYSAVSGSLVGLAISQSLILTGMLQYGMRQTSEVVNQLTSVDRIVQYTKLQTEGPFETPKENEPPRPWPSKGLLEFKNMSLKYVEDEPPVLKNLTFTIYAGEKVGIVGRTGAGKSSLISALFRLAPIEGSICIDGVSTEKLGLTELRKTISIIPQEPVLFSATMRYNLDPFNEFEDKKLWRALEEVELKDAVTSLDFMVTEGGGNFSLGQRQLICLARAILRNNKLLVLDEATANVDPRTDSFIQATIREKFKDCTVLTIAHRLNTIMDSDKVLVMSFGSMLEFDHPHKLLQIPDGHFHQMVLETGPVMSLQLKDVAMETYNKK